MVLQITTVEKDKAGLERAVKEISRIANGQESVVARSSSREELEGYLNLLKGEGLEIGEGDCYELGHKYLPAENNQIRLVIFRRSGRGRRKTYS